ncbi:MAG: 50S ribosomal protein L5 [Nanoarchaeota archaeon]
MALNKMQEVEMEKLVLSFGGVKDELEKGYKLLQKISKEKPSRRISVKRIPGFGVRPKLEVGCMVTLRGDKAKTLLKRLLVAIDHKIKKKQIAKNHFSFGIKEYIEIPGEDYDREIGMLGFNVVVVFSRKGKRVSIKKIKRGRLPERQHVTKEEIVKFMKENFNVVAE